MKTRAITIAVFLIAMCTPATEVESASDETPGYKRPYSQQECLRWHRQYRAEQLTYQFDGNPSKGDPFAEYELDVVAAGENCDAILIITKVPLTEEDADRIVNDDGYGVKWYAKEFPGGIGILANHKVVWTSGPLTEIQIKGRMPLCSDRNAIPEDWRYQFAIRPADQACPLAP